MELQLGLALPYYSTAKLVDSSPASSSSSLGRKRSFFHQHDDAAPEHSSSTHTDHNDDVMLPVPSTLSLLPLLTPNHHSTTTDEDDDDLQGPVVGWPPLINYRIRKKLRHHLDELLWIPPPPHHNGSNNNNKSKPQYVKVKMEGIGIARKIDIAIHHSFHSLNQTLMHMFGKCDEESKCYELVYQDKEGDWLLAQDIPWRSFIHCAQRLKLLKISSSTR